MNQTSKVNALIEERLGKLSKILGENHPYILRVILVCHQSLARLYRNSANSKEALDHALRALTYQQQISSEKENRLFEANELNGMGSFRSTKDPGFFCENRNFYWSVATIKTNKNDCFVIEMSPKVYMCIVIISYDKSK